MIVHWTFFTDDRGRWRITQPTWQEAFRFMDSLVAQTDDEGCPIFREVCYQRLPEGVAPTA